MDAGWPMCARNRMHRWLLDTNSSTPSIESRKLKAVSCSLSCTDWLQIHLLPMDPSIDVIHAVTSLSACMAWLKWNETKIIISMSIMKPNDSFISTFTGYSDSCPVPNRVDSVYMNQNCNAFHDLYWTYRIGTLQMGRHDVWMRSYSDSGNPNILG